MSTPPTDDLPEPDPAAPSEPAPEPAPPIPPAATSGAGTPLVLLHAFPLDGRMWAPQVEALAGT
jgi:pimeloyl-ACP methyl ester carboxylesterase